VVGSEKYTSSALAIKELETIRIHRMNCESYTQNNPKQVKWFWNAWQIMFPLDGKMLTSR